MLLKHWPTINAAQNGKVMVPLCGKSLDMLWLAKQGYSIVGLEMVDKAIHDFFAENELNYTSKTTENHTEYSSQKFTIYQGNVLDFEGGTLDADAWYDRAAMIAIDPSIRQAYVEQIRSQTKPGAVGLLITFAYPQEQMAGPPFALHDEHVFDLFHDGFTVECLETVSLEDERDRGLSEIHSSVFKITRL